MSVYARIESGRLAEVIQPISYDFNAADGSFKAGDEIPVSKRFTAEFVSSLVDITSVTPAPSVGWPYDGKSFSNPAPTEAQLLAIAQTSQAADIDASYSAAVQTSVSFKTAGGVTETFQADSDSQTVLMQAVQGYQMAGAVPTGFYWKAADNTLVTFALTDLEGLYGTILAQGWAAFQKRTTLKAQIAAATTVAAVQAVVWS